MAQTRLVNGPTLEHNQDAIIRRLSRLVLSKERRSVPLAKGYNVYAPQSAPMGVLGLCPGCGGETAIRLVAPTNALRLVEPMNARSERRTFECKACHERQAFIVVRVGETIRVTRVIRH
jgi:hypothetical protein